MASSSKASSASHLATMHGLELVFDVLFVFTVTQLAKSLARDHSGAGLARTTVLVVLLWWTFGSYASLSRAQSTRVGRALLTVGIIANLGLALSVPYATTTDRLPFALSYAVAVAAHVTLGRLEQPVRGRPLVARLLVAAAAPTLVLAGALVGGDTVLVWWAVAAVVALSLPSVVGRLSRSLGAAVAPAPAELDRFVQRHGVILILLLGEAVLTIGIGLGAAFRELDHEQVLVALTAVALAGTLYYAYFGERDDDAAYRALDRAPAERRSVLALLSFGYAFALMLIGVDFAVVGVSDAIAHPEAVPSLTFGGYLAGGVGAYWVGLGLFRLAIGRGFARSRILFGVALVAWAFLGRVSGLAELAALLAGSLVMLAVETRTPRRRLEPAL